jgi:hypothetical protein
VKNLSSLIRSTSLALVGVALASACAPSANSRLAAPNEAAPLVKPQSAFIAAEVQYQPKVDILFVIDNSLSMDPHQANLRKNISRFVREFGQDATVDFHIGVVSIYDRITIKSDGPNYFPVGKLRPLVDNTKPGQPVTGTFVTRSTPNYTQVLGDTIVLGTTPPSQNGPEFEEMLSPVLPALDPSLNPGFIRSDAHLAVIFLTDADDSSLISEGQLTAGLIAAKGGNKNLISTYGVLSYGDCQRDYGLRGKNGANDRNPVKMFNFLRQMNGHVYNLCSADFGADIADAGTDIERKATEALPVRVKLSKIPEYGSLQVRMAGQKDPLPVGDAWTYDPATNSIVLNGKSPSLAGMTGKIEVSVIEINHPFDIESGRIHRVGDAK